MSESIVCIALQDNPSPNTSLPEVGKIPFKTRDILHIPVWIATILEKRGVVRILDGRKDNPEPINPETIGSKTDNPEASEQEKDIIDLATSNFLSKLDFSEDLAKECHVTIDDAKRIVGCMAKWRAWKYPIPSQDLAFLLQMNSATLRKYLSYLQKCGFVENETVELTQKKIRGRYRLKLGLDGGYGEIDNMLWKSLLDFVSSKDVSDAVDDFMCGLSDIIVIDLSDCADERMRYEILGQGTTENNKKEYKDLFMCAIAEVYSQKYDYNMFALENLIEFTGEGKEMEDRNMQVKKNIGKALKIRGVVVGAITRSVPIWIDFVSDKDVEYRHFLNGYEKIRLALGEEIKQIRPPLPGSWKRAREQLGDITVVRIQTNNGIIDTDLVSGIDVSRYKGQLCEATVVPNMQLQSDKSKESIQDWYDLKNLKSLEREKKVQPDRNRALQTFCPFYLGAEDVKEVIFDAYMYYDDEHFRETIIPVMLYAQSGEGKTKMLEELARQFDCTILKPNSLSATAMGYIRKVGDNNYMEVRPPDQPFLLADELDKMQPEELKILLTASGGEKAGKVRYGQIMASYVKGVPVFTILENYQELLKERKSLGRRQYILQIIRRCINLHLPKSESRKDRIKDHLDIVLTGKEEVTTDYIDAVKQRADEIKKRVGFNPANGLYKLDCYDKELKNYQEYLGDFIENVELAIGVEYDLTLDMLLLKLATGHAFSFGRDYVMMDDIKYVCDIVKSHAEALGMWKGAPKKVYPLNYPEQGICEGCGEEKELKWTTLDGAYLCGDCARQYLKKESE